MVFLVDIKAKERLYREVEELMLKNGFNAATPYWRRTSNETIACLFIENYNSSYLFYISIGVYVIGLDNRGTKKPKLRQMHAWVRLRQLIPVTTQSNGNIVLKGNGIEDTNKTVDEVLDTIQRVGLKILDDLSSLDGTKRVLEYWGEKRWTIGPLLKEKLYGTASIRIRGTLPLRDWEIAGSVDPYHKS